MKIKNKFVLLIIMSLFLLISIGSVCASDNTLTDQAIQTYDENSDVSSIESEIVDDNTILSTNNDDTLLKADSSKATLAAAQTSADVNSSKIVNVKLNINDTADVKDLKPTVTYTKDNATKTVKTSDYSLNNGTYSFKLNYFLYMV